MKFKIHRGTKEIGGSCVEVWTENSRIVLDFGMPLIDRDGKDFDFGTYKNLDIRKLVELGILPDIKGLTAVRFRNSKVKAGSHRTCY